MFPKYVLFILIFGSFLLYATAIKNYNRFGFFNTIPKVLLSPEFIIKQINQVTTIHCIQLCMVQKNCLTAAFGMQTCVLYSTDPRAQLDEISVNRNETGLFILYTFSDAMKTLCYVNNLKVTLESDWEKCEISGKRVDSNCSDWTADELIYEDICGVSAEVFKYRDSYRNCTQPINFGAQCTGDNYIRKEKFVFLPGGAAVYGMAAARAVCTGHGLALFSGIYYISENRWPWSGNYFTDFYKNGANGVSWRQFVAPGCSSVWGAGQPDGAFGPEPNIWVTDGKLHDHSGVLPAFVACQEWTEIETRACNDPYFSLLSLPQN